MTTTMPFRKSGPAGWSRDPEVRRTQIRAAWADPDHCRILVALLRGEIQGFIKVTQRTDYYEHCEVEILAVDEAHRDAGIGTELMAVATQWCADQGEHEVELGVVSGNARAMQLYELPAHPAALHQEVGSTTANRLLG